MLKVFSQADKVILDLCGRKRAVLLSPLQAEKLADAIDDKAHHADLAAAELVRGERWQISVKSYDGRVVLIVIPPGLEAPRMVSLPAKAARAVSDLLRSNAEWAGVNLRIELRNAEPQLTGTEKRK